MAVRQWSSESVTAEHRDLAATSCSLDREGRLAVLAGRRCLALIDLEQPHSIVKKINRQSRWEAGPVEWNPGEQHSNHLAAVCHDKVEIYVWNNNHFVVQDPIRAHTRSVSDIHWNPGKASLLASSSPDGYIHCWDLRDLHRPCQSFCNLVGANYIRWNRHNSHILASAHDGDVKVWDARQGTSPVTYISAHLSRLHSLDWSYKDESQLVTASSDCTVKFHAVGPGKSKDCSPAALSTAVPVWRARHTPFGEGLVTVLVPHLSRQEHSLFLWNMTNLTAPVHSFFGHRDVILDFDWRRSGPDYQMVTWSKDQSLRIWNLDQETQYRCGLEDTEFVNSDGVDRSDNDDIFDQALEASEELFIDSDRDDDDDDQSTVKRGDLGEFPRSWSGDRESLCDFVAAASVREHSPRSAIENTLQQEFALLDTSYTIIRVAELDIDKRVCKVTSSTAHCKINMAIIFPQLYPRNTPPTFTFLKGTSLNPGNKNRILKSLKATANQQVKRNRACLERCLRQLESQLEQISQEATVEDEATKSSFPFATNTVSDYGMPMSGGQVLQGFRQSFQDSNIPYPRTSGARFCGNGHLVCFGRPAYQKKVQNSLSQCPGPTPRTYSAYLAPDPWKPSPSSFYPSLHLGSNVSPTRENYDFTSESLPFVQERQLNVVKRGRFRVRQVGSVEDGQTVQAPDRHVRTQPAPERQLRTQPAQDRQDRVLRTVTVQERHAQLRTKKSNRSRRESNSSVSLRVTVYNVSGLLPFSRDLAVNYIVAEDPVKMCQHNVAVAAEAGKPQLVQVWKLTLQVVEAASETKDDAWGPWALCPMGSKLIRSILDHHLKSWDIQTVAMLICALTKPTKAKVESVESGVEPLVQNVRDKFWFLRSGALTGSSSSGDSPYHTIHSVSGVAPNPKSETTLEHFFQNKTQKSLRSNSWTETIQDSSTSSSSTTSLAQVPARAEARYELLDNADIDKYSPVLTAYSDILYRWGLMLQRASLMKHCSTEVDKYLMEKVGSTCSGCQATLTHKYCSKCSTPALTCSICRLPVLGLSVVCPSCGHGGHLLHVKEWAETHKECATGCGCKCHNLF